MSNNEQMSNNEHTEIDELNLNATPVQPGLWLVATPIGNLKDITSRAIDILRSASLICCEDTRRSGNLMKLLGINMNDNDARFLVTNEHTEFPSVQRVIETLGEGKVVAMITDAGTPAISDPGSHLVRAAIDAGFPVWSAPGPAAFVSALIVSGLPTERVAFDGFLPRSGTERSQRVSALAHDERTVVLYEAPHRLEKTLKELAQACGNDREIVVCREITKMHEETWRGTFGDAIEMVSQREPRGEYVIVIAPYQKANAPVSDHAIKEALEQHIANGLSKKSAVDAVATEFDVARNRVYSISIEM